MAVSRALNLSRGLIHVTLELDEKLDIIAAFIFSEAIFGIVASHSKFIVLNVVVGFKIAKNLYSIADTRLKTNRVLLVNIRQCTLFGHPDFSGT